MPPRSLLLLLSTTMLSLLFLLGETRSVAALEVHSPLSLAGRLYAMVASFGPPLVTTRMVRAEIAFAVPATACGPVENAKALRGRIAVVHRGGGCSFTTKALAVQSAGAIGCIVVNTPRTSADQTLEHERQQLFVLADDGAGRDVIIPMEMVTATDAEPMLDAARAGRSVVASLGFRLETKDYYDF